MVRVENLGITYATIGRSSRRPWQRQRQTVEALSGVNLEISSGECVGFVGGNGAGKSTLLRTIAGICAPSTGSVLVREQPWLLGVQAALMPRLTGSQNIDIGLLSLGMSSAEVAELAPKVAEFSDLDEALHRPMKTYSSGMRARLQFSIATVRRPEILLLDEALAVGDLHFKRRSLRRINTIREKASTILIVSHNAQEIQRTCTRVVWMENGAVVQDGDTEEILAAYAEANAG